MNNNDIVRDMLRGKFTSRSEVAQQKEIENNGTIRVPKEVSNSIHSKLGLGKGMDKARRIEELSKLNIKDVLSHIEKTDTTYTSSCLKEEGLI